LAVADGDHDAQFPIDVFQTGSGTSSNMNANEVIAHLASRALGTDVHPNDHVNMGQSSNDVFPTAIHVAASLAIVEQLLPSLRQLSKTIRRKGRQLKDITKTGRTHLMDAVPASTPSRALASASPRRWRGVPVSHSPRHRITLKACPRRMRPSRSAASSRPWPYR
jgi:fumarate hydratase class II